MTLCVCFFNKFSAGVKISQQLKLIFANESSFVRAYSYLLNIQTNYLRNQTISSKLQYVPILVLSPFVPKAC